MKTIDEHNAEIKSRYEDKYSTGIECPRCKHELHYPTPSIIMTSYPPQKDVVCIRCNYRGRVYC